MLGGIRDIEYNEGNTDRSTNQRLKFKHQFDNLISEQIKSGEFFYGLLHRRYVLTNAGINKILKNFDEGIDIENNDNIQPRSILGLYGKCQKLKCNGQNCLPIGSVEVNSSTVQLYCPRCCDIFETEDSKLDGAFFGPNLPVGYNIFNFCQIALFSTCS